MRRDPRHVRTGVHVRVGTRGDSGRARAHASAKRRRAAASSRAEHAGSHRRIPEGVVGRHHARNSAQIARWKATLNTASSAEANRIARRDASNIRHASAPPPPRAPSPTPSASLSLRGRSVKIENAAGARRGRPNGRIWIAGSIFTLARARVYSDGQKLVARSSLVVPLGISSSRGKFWPAHPRDYQSPASLPLRFPAERWKSDETRRARRAIQRPINHRARRRCFGCDAAGETAPRGGALYPSDRARGRHGRIKGGREASASRRASLISVRAITRAYRR